MSRKRFGTFFVILFVILTSGCAVERAPSLENTTQPGATTPAGKTLFLDTTEIGLVDDSPFVSRTRFVKIDLALLLNEDGQPLPLDPGSRITLNLFPDLTYTGILDSIIQDEGGISWVGTLEGVEYSEMTLVYTGDAFIAHIASPAGVYEVSSLGDGLYRVVEINQNQLPGGEG